MVKGQTCYYVSCDCKSTDFEVDTGDEVLSCHVSTDANHYWIIASKLLRCIEAVYCSHCDRQLQNVCDIESIQQLGVAV